MKILVDADAFPTAVKEVLFRAAKRLDLPVTLVANQPMRLPGSDLITMLVVPDGPDVADDRIVEMVEPGDLVITADIPLADRVIAKGASAIDPRGELYSESNIKERLATRDLMEQLRDGGLVTGGPSGFNRKDVQAFADQLNRWLMARMRT